MDPDVCVVLDSVSPPPRLSLTPFSQMLAFYGYRGAVKDVCVCKNIVSQSLMGALLGHSES